MLEKTHATWYIYKKKKKQDNKNKTVSIIFQKRNDESVIAMCDPQTMCPHLEIQDIGEYLW